MGKLPKSEHANFLEPLIKPSIKAAIECGQSLALIRPRNTLFHYRRKSTEKIEEEREAFKSAASQTLMFDDELAALEPSPFEFRFRFEDDRPHDFQNGDWEAHAMFYNGIRRGLPEQEVLDWMDHTFNVEFRQRGMLFAVGNMAKRPQTWQLLGVLRVEDSSQGALPF